MQILLIFLFSLFGSLYAYSWGTNSCGPPNHGSGSTSATRGLTLTFLPNKSLLLSGASFKGFLLRTDSQLIWSSPSSGTATSVCGGGNTAIMHTNKARKSSVSAFIACTPGETFTVTGYVVFAEEEAYVNLQHTFTCPSTATTAPPQNTLPGGPTIAPVDGIVYTPVGGTGQLTSLNVLTVQWTPSMAYSSSSARTSAPFGESVVDLLLQTNGESQAWIGLGIGYADYTMSGNKKAVVLEANNGACTVSFYTLVSHIAVRVTGSSDPWGVAPSCQVISADLVSAQFTIGGSSSITLPPSGTAVYLLIAGGSGGPLGDHGSNWDYKQVDFLSTDNIVTPTTTNVNPWYFAHGLIFIAVFAILMPLTSFLILTDKVRFYSMHKWIGGLILALLVAGYAVLSGTSEESSGNYAPFSSDPNGLDHTGYGSIGVWVGFAICAGGVILWWFRLPPTMKKVVRYAHGLGGIALSFYGPYTVWTGWVLLQPVQPTITALTSTPWLWLVLAITFGVIYVSSRFVDAYSGKKDKRVAGKARPKLMTEDAVTDLVEAGKLILIHEKKVYEIPDSFSHPGGKAVMHALNGTDVGEAMAGVQAVNVNGRMRRVPHSADAFAYMQKFQIGVLGTEPAVATPAAELAAAVALGGVVEARLSRGTLLSSQQINTAEDFPVKLFQIQLPDTHDFAKVSLGSRMYISIPGSGGLERPYTVCNIDAIERTVWFAIKIYPNGQLTRKLDGLQQGEALLVSKPVAHPPVPSLPYYTAMLVFIAGGTGMVPMLSYFAACGNCALGGVLLWWVRNELDLFLLNDLNRWVEAHSVKLRVQIFFTQPIGNDGGSPVDVARLAEANPPEFVNKTLTGRISPLAIAAGLGGILPLPPADMGFLMSGPSGFVTAAETALADLHVPPYRILSLD